MSLEPSEQRLLRISKSTKRELDYFKEGVSLEARALFTIDELKDQACADRIALAESFIQQADKLMRSRPPMYRIATGRFYYGMYHAMRAVVFYRTPGDDHEQHSKLSTQTPDDFPDSESWKNTLKFARLRRNEADYDAYPRGDVDFKATARTLQVDANTLLQEARDYLLLKGCTYL